MEPVGRILPARLMASSAAQRILSAVSLDGAPARFVGGCVRDAVLGREVKDVDIATPLPPDEIIRLLDAASIRSIPTGIDHGTITAVCDGNGFEITTLRRDVETHGRHATVAFTDDWALDAARRDFTMNALYADGDGTLYDPVGGMDDLKAGRVRFVGDARTRIEEDVLRLLRFFRFHAWYGDGLPDEEAVSACRAFADKLPGLSAERVWSEFSRILGAPDPVMPLGLMRDGGVLPELLAEAGSFDALARLVPLEEAHAGGGDPVRRLAALISGGAELAQTLAERYRLSNDARGRLALYLVRRNTFTPDTEEVARRSSLYRMGPTLCRDLMLLGRAGASDQEAAGDDARWQALVGEISGWQPVELPVSGADVLALGIPPGPEIGKLLLTVEEWWIAEAFGPDRNACLARLAGETKPGRSEENI